MIGAETSSVPASSSPSGCSNRRGGRVVDGSGLENRHTRKGIGGSNPSLSAIAFNSIGAFATAKNGAELANSVVDLQPLRSAVLSSLATIGGGQREHRVRSGCVIHKERGLRTHVVLFVLVQRIGRPGTFRFVLIRDEPGEPSLQFGIFGRDSGALKN